MTELWLRPWALAAPHHRVPLAPRATAIPLEHHGPVWIYRAQGGAGIEGAEVAGFAGPTEARRLSLMPLALRHARPLVVGTPGGQTALSWQGAPERPDMQATPATPAEEDAQALMLRAEEVWDRLADVDAALADPARLWSELHRRWTDTSDAPPTMDVIVRHARDLDRTLTQLEAHPRRFLRRTHARLPLARVQELDRRAMLWLVRQPGETLAERAGDTQRLLAVAREESFDTLENRVLRAYAVLAEARARDYLRRNPARRSSPRARRVECYGRRCGRLARELAARGVRLAEPGCMPNFVLQQNPAYRAVWEGWEELLRVERKRDDLWRWQARSWEEFCTLLVMVALTALPGARLIAGAPIVFREEQDRGSWVSHDNPLGVIYLPEAGVVIELARGLYPGGRLADLGAPLWLRFGRVGDTQGFLRRLAVWPLWDIAGGLVSQELEELAGLLPGLRSAELAGGLVLRPASLREAVVADALREGMAEVLTLGVEGAALARGLALLGESIAARVAEVD